jgi:hypothetical protein
LHGFHFEHRRKVLSLFKGNAFLCNKAHSHMTCIRHIYTYNTFIGIILCQSAANPHGVRTLPPLLLMRGANLPPLWQAGTPPPQPLWGWGKTPPLVRRGWRKPCDHQGLLPPNTPPTALLACPLLGPVAVWVGWLDNAEDYLTLPPPLLWLQAGQPGCQATSNSSPLHFLLSTSPPMQRLSCASIV